ESLVLLLLALLRSGARRAPFVRSTTWAERSGRCSCGVARSLAFGADGSSSRPLSIGCVGELLESLECACGPGPFRACAGRRVHFPVVGDPCERVDQQAALHCRQRLKEEVGLLGELPGDLVVCLFALGREVDEIRAAVSGVRSAL